MQKKSRTYITPPKLKGYNFSPVEAWSAKRKNRLLSMRLETGPACNLNCIYCNGLNGKRPAEIISFATMKRVIAEVRQLGARSVVVIGGGEPTIYPYFKQLVEYINKQGLIPVVITNGLKLDPGMCLFLWRQNASVLFKLDSLKESQQDILSGSEGAFRKIIIGMNNLFACGFSKKDNMGEFRCGASFVVTKINYRDIPGLWKFCRENSVYPNLEELIPRNRGLYRLDELWVDKNDLKELKEKLLEIDRKEYGYDWLVNTPLPGQGCLQHLYSVYVACDGYVRPCADIDVKISNVSKSSILEIIKTPFFRYTRNIDKYLQGKCFHCEHNDVCVGCRGLAFSMGVNEGLDPFKAVSREDPVCCK